MECAKFILKIREEYRLPQATLSKVIVDMEGLWLLSINSLRKKVEEQIGHLESTVIDCFEDNFPMVSLKTAYADAMLQATF